MRDAIVVGAGGGGAVVAKELAARGLDVLLLEAGGDAAPDSDWSHFEHDANDSIQGYMRFGPSDRARSPWVRDLPQNMVLYQSSGVGGSTQHYFGNSPRAFPGAFVGHVEQHGAVYDAAHRFPFSYRELVPYYEWVEATLPVQTAAIGRKEVPFLEAAERVGYPLATTKDVTRASYRPQENAILQPEGTAGQTSDPDLLRFPQARGCTFCGHCFQGCKHPHEAPPNLVAKRSADVSYVPMALTADRWAPGGRRAELVTDAFVIRVGTERTLAGEEVARSVTWRSTRTGLLATEEARVVVLSAGPVETPRLWLNSRLPNPNDWVGRGLTDHYNDWVIGVMPEPIGATRGPTSAARVDLPGRGCIEQAVAQPGLIPSVAVASDSGIWGHYDNGTPAGLHGADALGRRVGNDFKQVMAALDRLLAVFVLTDDDVEPQNRVRLGSGLPPDEHGPVARVEVPLRRRSRRTVENREHAVAKAVELIRAAGAEHIWRIDQPPYLVHIHSTMRMGTDPSDSVLDPHGESRAVRRLFVADSSALSNGAGGPNPTLTIQAVATRTAERIFQTCFGGEPWVQAESPVPSTDDAVTSGVLARARRRWARTG
jgi:choline dehydrogenase-like flavoprotein